ALAEELWSSVPALSRHRSLDPRLGAILQGCLQSDPEARVANGLLLKRSLERWLDRRARRLGPEELAARITQLVPGGNVDWRAEGVPSAFTMAASTGRSGVERKPPPPRSSPVWLRVVVMAAGIAMLLAVSALVSGSAASLFWIWRL